MVILLPVIAPILAQVQCPVLQDAQPSLASNLGVAATVAAVSRKEPVFELSDVDSSKQVSEDEQI